MKAAIGNGQLERKRVNQSRDRLRLSQNGRIEHQKGRRSIFERVFWPVEKHSGKLGSGLLG